MEDSYTRKPLGIYLIAILFLTIQVYTLVIYFWIVGLQTNSVYITGTIAVLAKIIFGIIAAIGLLKFKAWGRNFMILFCIINLIDILIAQIMHLFLADVFSGDVSVFILALSIISIVYLSKPTIKKFFQSKSPRI